MENISNAPTIEREKINNSQVISYLRSIQNEFMNELENFGKKTERGFQTTIKNIKINDPNGKFTGSDLCKLGSGLLEEGLKIKYKNQIEVFSFRINTSDMDIDVNKKPEEKEYVKLHYITRFKTINNNEWITVDSTYRQLQKKVKPEKILIFPTRNEDKIYTYKPLFEHFSQKKSELANHFIVKQMKPGENYQECLANIKSGGYRKATENDCQKILNLFRR